MEPGFLLFPLSLSNRDTNPNSSGRDAEEAMPQSLSRHTEARDRADGGKEENWTSQPAPDGLFKESKEARKKVRGPSPLYLWLAFQRPHGIRGR